ncbi:hypothetical protein BDD12DRAFT_835411 [Trichophaea hybrida]|nr:hypothetical protein BDD12DRAFT_835411 [Trichophaea hybrida]
MAHTCGVCNTKTTSKQFKRTCFEKHEYVCDRFHRTLLRSGKTDSCSACVQEMEMDERRTRELEAAQKALEELKLEETTTTGVCAKRNRGMSTKLKKAVCKVEEMEDRLREIKWNTESELKEREAGFLRWKS